jgi:hypothetical protein
MIEAMTQAIDMADELAKAEGSVEATVSRQSSGYEVLRPIINAAMRQSGKVDEGLADFLKASPILAHYLARWQRTDQVRP